MIRRSARRARRGPLPGFGLSTGVTVAWVGLVVLLPLSAVVAGSAATGAAPLLALAASPRALAALRLSLAAALGAAALDAAAGLLVAWVLARHRFPGRSLVDALVDLPFALPTAVSGLALTEIYAPSGWLGRWIAPLGLRVDGAALGVVVALAFIGLPFAVRSVQPAIEAVEPEAEEAARVLGATRGQIFRTVILPVIAPAALTGFALAFARGVGEYGAVVLISGNVPGRTEVVPRLLVARLEAGDRAGAAAVATALLAVSFLLLLALGRLQAWSRARAGLAGP